MLQYCGRALDSWTARNLDERLHEQSFELVGMLTSFLGWLYAFNCFYKYTLSIVNEHGEPLPVEAHRRL